jgi:hypothetical protein
MKCEKEDFIRKRQYVCIAKGWSDERQAID